jgi:putative Mn2+ efflux pump MntP
MTLVEIVVIAVGLAMDAFAVSVAGAAGGRLHHPRPAIRLAFHLGLFQALMPIIGWFLGSQAVRFVGGYGRWIAFGLLVYIGGRMILESAGKRGPDPDLGPDPSRGWTMVGLSVATSIDALAVGVSLAMLGVAIWQPSVIIGVVTAAISLVGIVIGDRVGRRLGAKVELLGGLLLIVIGLRILVGGI